MSSTDTSSSAYDGPSVYPQAIILSTLGFLSFILATATLAIHLESDSRKLSTTVLILSISLAALQNAVNPLIWPNDDIWHWPLGHILCDIEAKLQVGLSVAIPASATCICRHLASVLSPNTNTTTLSPIGSSTKRIRLSFDLALCVLVPLYAMSIHILIQPNRYYIHGISGCQYSLSRTWLTLPTLLIWSTVAGLLGTFYATIVLIRLRRHSREVSSLLHNSQTSRSRFLRAFALAGIVAVGSAPLTVFNYVVGLDGTPGAWSWEGVHPEGWSRRVLRVESHGSVGFDRWVQVVGGFAVWVVFGLKWDVRVSSGAWIRWVGVSWVKRVAVRLYRGRERRGRSEEVGQLQQPVREDVRGVEIAGLALDEIGVVVRRDGREEEPATRRESASVS